MSSLRQKFFVRGLVPPALIFVPISALFLTQVIQIEARSRLSLLAIAAGLYLGGAAFLVRYLGPLADRLEVARGRDEVTRAASALLQRSVRLNLLIWFVGAIVFSITGFALVLRSGLGFSYLLTAAFMTCVAGVAWNYGSTKRTIFEALRTQEGIFFDGRSFNVGRKIAITFLTVFLISSVALVQLITAKVSSTLEALAVSREADRFERLYRDATILARVDREALSTFDDYLPEGYEPFRIDANGTLTSGGDESLQPNTIADILERRNGDSTQFVSPDVVRFQSLNDGSILVLKIPWAPFAALPWQIAFYASIVVLITTIAMVVAALYLASDVTRPVRRLAKVANDMALGRFAKQTSIFADDEIGALARSFAETRENLRRLVGQIGGSGQTITEGVRVIRDGTHALIDRASTQTTLTSEASEAVLNVRNGAESVLSAAEKVTDLTQDSSSRALELQAATEEVARSMEYLFQSVEKTSSSTTEMDASAREMSARTETLSQIGEEVLSFVSEMDSTVDELRRTAESTAEISRQVQEDAELGGVAVAETVQGIVTAQESARRTASVLDSLQKSVSQISQIVNVIEEIADRTNLLSLNAAIIAAQAGEHGAGFTVVAEEIRELADRTRGSTNEIVGIIKKVQTGSTEAVRAIAEDVRRIDQNVGLAQNASESLEKIVASSAESYDMANRIARSLEQQSEASSHLHHVTSRMRDQISEMNRSTQEQERGTRLLAEEAERVREIALVVRNSTEQQSVAGKGIAQAMEQIASDVRRIRDLLGSQLKETDRIAGASQTMLEIAKANGMVARDFTDTVSSLLLSGQRFDDEVKRFEM